MDFCLREAILLTRIPDAWESSCGLFHFSAMQMSVQKKICNGRDRPLAGTTLNWTLDQESGDLIQQLCHCLAMWLWKILCISLGSTRPSDFSMYSIQKCLQFWNSNINPIWKLSLREKLGFDKATSQSWLVPSWLNLNLMIQGNSCLSA